MRQRAEEEKGKSSSFLLSPGIVDTNIPVISDIEVDAIMNSTGILVAMSGGGTFPIKVSFKMVTPYFNQEKRKNDFANKKQAQFKAIHGPVTGDPQLVNGRGCHLDRTKRATLINFLRRMPVNSNHIFGNRLGIGTRIKAGYYPLGYSYYQEVINLLEKGQLNSAAVSIGERGFNDIGFLTIYFSPDQDHQIFYR